MRGGRSPREGVASIALLCLLLPVAAAGSVAAQAEPEEAGPAEQTAAGEEVATAEEAAAAEEAGPAGWFEGGVRAFDEERYFAAAEAFDRYVELRPMDPEGWYNLGTSYHRAGYPGYAAWAWLHVPRLDPRHRDVRHNLSVAGVPPELVDRVAPPFPLRPTELLFLASIAWLVTGVAGALWLARRRRRAGATAAAALLLALALAGAGLASTRGPETLIVLESSILRAGPTLRAEPIAELDPGAGLTPVTSRGDWVRARTLRGDEGWIEASRTGTL